MNKNVTSLNIGWIQAGSTFNVILRTANMSQNRYKNKIFDRIGNLTKFICETYGYKCISRKTAIYPTVINHGK